MMRMTDWKRRKKMSSRKKCHLIAWLLVALGTAGLLAAIVFQIVLKVQEYGTAFEASFVPHWSAGLAATVLLYIPAFVIYILGGE